MSSFPSLDWAAVLEKMKAAINNPCSLQRCAMVYSSAVFPAPAGPFSQSMDADSSAPPLTQSMISWMMATRVPSKHCGWSRRAFESRRAADEPCWRRRSIATVLVSKSNIDDTSWTAHLLEGLIENCGGVE